MGTIERNCFDERGNASGSALAAAVMIRSSVRVGMRTRRRFGVLDIVFDLTTIRAAKDDDSSRSAPIDETPVDRRCERECDTMLCTVAGVLDGIELDEHDYCSYRNSWIQGRRRRGGSGAVIMDAGHSTARRGGRRAGASPVARR